MRELDEQEHERGRQLRRSRAAIRKQKLRALARLLAEGKTQRAAAAELGVSERTIHRWMRQPGFARELAKATSRHERDLKRERKREQTRRNHNERRRLRRHNPKLYYELYSPATPPERRRAQPPAAAPAQPAPRFRHRQQSHTVPSFRTRAKASDSGSPTTRRATRQPRGVPRLQRRQGRPRNIRRTAARPRTRQCRPSPHLASPDNRVLLDGVPKAPTRQAEGASPHQLQDLRDIRRGPTRAPTRSRYGRAGLEAEAGEQSATRDC
jgi:hypothetical protein